MPSRSAQSVFFEALEQDSPEKVVEFLDMACSGDSDLRSHVEDLLSAHREAGDFLGGVGVPIQVGDADDPDQAHVIGQHIGPYKILQEIGEGGFGVVYMAEQSDPVERKVALKIIKPGMDSREIIARFEAERQALAMMDHSNIARVLDANQTEEGRPYFAMELVRGVPITEYADKNQLTTRDRLDLFITVCRAVQHAHHKGIIHRDIKPSNVMVTLHDGTPVVKVIDFGVAKALNQKLTEKTLFTAYGQMVGTPQYMSPEQAEMSGLDVDTRSDVYSLGVLLYELLTGSTPITAESLRDAGFAEIQRLIREEDAPRLSARLSTMGDDLTVVAGHRSVEPKRLQQIVSGELDWIVLRALEKERGRRYESPGAFLADIQRYLQNAQVEACPPSRTYKIKKFASRNRGLVSAVTAVVASLLAGIAVATYASFIAEQRRIDAEQESARAKRVAQVLNEMLGAADPSSGHASDYTVREMLDDISSALDGRFADDPNVEGTVRHTIGRAYFHLGLPNASEPHLRRALALCDEAHQLNEAVILTDLARTLAFTATTTNELHEPERMARRAIEDYRARGESSTELANSLCILGWILDRKAGGVTVVGRNSEGELACREGIRILESATDMRNLTVKGRLYTGLAFELLRRRDEFALQEASDVAREAVRLLRAHRPNDHFMSMALRASGTCQMRLGRLHQAEMLLREAMKFDQRATGTVDVDTLQQLFLALFQQGKFGDTFELVRWTDTNIHAQLPPMHVRSQTVVGCFLMGLGDVEGAEVLFRHAVEDSKQLRQGNYATLEAQYWLGMALVGQDDAARQAQGREILVALLAIGRRVAEGGDDERFSFGFTNAVGHLDSPTMADVKLALDVNRRVLQQPLRPLARLRNLYAGALVRNHSGETANAMALLQEVIKSPFAYGWFEIAGDSPFLILRNAEDLLAQLLLDSGKVEAAEAVYRRGIERREQATRPDRYQLIFAQQRLAAFLLRHGDKEKARSLLTTAQNGLRDAPECFDWLRERIQDDLKAFDDRLPQRRKGD